MAGQDRSDRRAIVCAISADYAFALGSLITGFQRHNPDFLGRFVVFHDGLTDAQQSQLGALGCQLVFHAFGLRDVAARFGKGVDLDKVLSLYSPMIFAKFEMLDLLADYDICLWLDVDILVQGNLSEIWAFETLAWRPLHQGAFARRAAVMAEFADVCGDGTLPLLNGGVVGMGQGLRGQVSPADLYAMAARLLAQTDATSVDELALYFTSASRALDVHVLEERFNHPVVAPDVRDAVLVHAIGPDKFWNSAPLRLAYPEWAQNLAAFHAVGGAGYNGALRLDDVQAASPDKALKAARNRAYWQQTYAALRPELPSALQVDLDSQHKRLRFFYEGADGVYLHLIRQMNERRIGIEVHFPDDAVLAPQLFAQLDKLAIAGLAKGKMLELARTKQGRACGAVVPVAYCATAMGALVAALDQATSRAKS